MYKIQTLNKISAKGLEQLNHDRYEYASEIINPDAILVRSQDMHSMELPSTLKAIARAGAGVNNIPIDKCSSKGIVVFNTPGANANAVKELVLLAILLSSRRIYPGISWVKSLAGGDVKALVEKHKSAYVGPEIKGKRLGVIGLGAIGVMVANDAVGLGMDVWGYDPYISVESAWGMSRSVKKSTSLDSLIAESDYITIHTPLNKDTREMMNAGKFGMMKKGARLINFARGELVNHADLKEALSNGTVSFYVTDFPTDDIITLDNVIPVPHLGASTPESEENCAIMAVNQLVDFLESGNIHNSVNFPECVLPFYGKKRLVIANRNVPNMIGQITPLLAEHKINIADMLNKSRGDYAYNIIDVDNGADEAVLGKIMGIEGVLMARVI
ncbi:MAG: phosphoglycerate dehydrogenase [Spirochaetes bacterium]|jgi:D-3-phosphoglycerate dehydrogenase|nr:phosphoglycerate dehydrogenase [Spirochaetota bacterium]